MLSNCVRFRFLRSLAATINSACIYGNTRILHVDYERDFRSKNMVLFSPMEFNRE